MCTVLHTVSDVSTPAPGQNATLRLGQENELGYSFWLAVVAAVFMALATLFASVNAFKGLSVVV